MNSQRSAAPMVAYCNDIGRIRGIEAAGVKI
jgi:hypothetical protein